MRNVTLEKKIVIFKTLALSKIVFQSLINFIANHVIFELTSIQINFTWQNSNPKTRHET